jgi:hypothetical protein
MSTNLFTNFYLNVFNKRQWEIRHVFRYWELSTDGFAKHIDMYMS